jgi:hypothetical protein
MGDPLDFAVITALVLAATQALAPTIRAALRHHARRAQSFGGGVGLAYIFLTLFPEVEGAHPWLGHRIHIITLLSFILFFSLEAWLIARARLRAGQGGPPVEAPVFWLHIAIMGFYTAIVMFALPESIAGDLLFAVATGFAIGVHLVYKDYVLRTGADEQFQLTGRALLTLAPLLGWVAHRLVDPSEAVLDLSMAVLAGVLMQSVFRDELPRPDTASIGWMLAGVSVFGLLVYLS